MFKKMLFHILYVNIFVMAFNILLLQINILKGGFTMFAKKKVKNQNAKTEVKKNVTSTQDVLPFKGLYKNGIIETVDGVFSKSYTFDNTNFLAAAEEDQERIFLDFGKLLNSLEANTMAQIVSYNQTINRNEFKDNILLKLTGDAKDEYRKEYNNMLCDKSEKGTNNTRKEIRFITSIPCDNIEIATNEYGRMDATIVKAIKTINKSNAKAEDAYERINSIHKMFNPYNQEDFMPKSEFDLDKIASQGISIKDLIASSSIEFNNKHFILDGDTYGSVLFLDNLPSSLAANIFTDLTSTANNTIVSCTYKPLDINESAKLIKNQTININGSVIDAQKKAAKEGYSANLISPDLQNAQSEAEELRDDITNRNQKLFLTSVTVVVFGRSLEDLNKQVSTIKTVANKHLCLLKELSYQQREGLCTALPFARKDIRVDRLLTTESASVFLPFSTFSVNQPNGIYYGQNALTNEMIVYDRFEGMNPNGVILGKPGSGKSFSSKREIVHALLQSDRDEVYIIDPEREYVALADLLGGQVITLSSNTNVHVNPMDLDTSDVEGDPISSKSDYIIGLISAMVGSYGISSIQRSVADRCIRKLYVEYCDKLKRINLEIAEENKTLPEGKKKPIVTCSPADSPTLVDLFNLLKSQMEPEARNLALGIETFCIGSMNMFAHKTNVEIHSNFVVYDIKEMGSNLYELGIQVCLNDIWIHMFDNFKKGKRTRFYIDEFYLLLRNELSSKFLQMIWKRARKWKGSPTGMTQNIEDLLNSPEARTILNTSNFVMLLSQSPMDKQELANIFSLSEEEQEHITNQGYGHGILILEDNHIPFDDDFPQDTQLFKVMTTKHE